MQITGTHFNYFQICRRKLWLFGNGLLMEHTSDLVYEGKMIHENSYSFRSDRFKEVEAGGIKIDFYDPKNRVVHEIKKSDKREEAHLWQLKYYLYILEYCGVENPSGILEYPALRKKEEVYLSEVDRITMVEMLTEIEKVLNSEIAPERLMVSRCRNCSYFDLCWSGEVSDDG
jgi:CRISPR-associated exonuclease Cas4